MNTWQLETKDAKVIDVTPTWEGVLFVLIAALRNPEASKENVGIATDELLRMAKLADRYVETQRKRK